MSRPIPIRNDYIPEARTMMGKLLSDFTKDNRLVARCSAIRGFDVGVRLYEGYLNLQGPFYVFDEQGRNPQNPVLEVSILDSLYDIPNSIESDNIVDGVLIKLEDEQKKDINSKLFRRICSLDGAFNGVEILSALARKSNPLSDAEYRKSAKSLENKVMGHIKKDFEIVPEIFYDSPYVDIAERHKLRTLETTLETIERREPESYNKFSTMNHIKCNRFDTSILYFYNLNGILTAEASIIKGGAHTYHNRDYHFRNIKLIDRAHQDDFVKDFLSTFDFGRGRIKRKNTQEIQTETTFGRLFYTDIADTEGKSVPVTHKVLTF